MATLARARFRVSFVKVHGQSPYIKLYQKYYNYTTCSCNNIFEIISFAIVPPTHLEALLIRSNVPFLLLYSSNLAK